VLLAARGSALHFSHPTARRPLRARLPPVHRSGPDLRRSATDLANLLSCRHRTALNMAVAQGKLRRPRVDDPLLEILAERGKAHEKAYVDSLRAQGLSVVDITRDDDGDTRTAETRRRRIRRRS